MPRATKATPPVRKYRLGDDLVFKGRRYPTGTVLVERAAFFDLLDRLSRMERSPYWAEPVFTKGAARLVGYVVHEGPAGVSTKVRVASVAGQVHVALPQGWVV